MRGVDPGGDTVHFYRSWGGQEDCVRTFPARFEASRLVSAHPNTVSNLERVWNDWFAGLFPVGGGQRLLDLFLDNLESLQMSFERGAVSMVCNLGVKESDHRWGSTIDYLEGGQPVWSWSVPGPV